MQNNETQITINLINAIQSNDLNQFKRSVESLKKTLNIQEPPEVFFYSGQRDKYQKALIVALQVALLEKASNNKIAMYLLRLIDSENIEKNGLGLLVLACTNNKPNVVWYLLYKINVKDIQDSCVSLLHDAITVKQGEIAVPLLANITPERIEKLSSEEMNFAYINGFGGKSFRSKMRQSLIAWINHLYTNLSGINSLTTLQKQGIFYLACTEKSAFTREWNQNLFVQILSSDSTLLDQQYRLPDCPCLGEAQGNMLIFAIIKGDNDLLAKLLDLGFDPNSRSTRGSTALHYAVAAANLEAVKLICQKNMAKNQGESNQSQDGDGRTPLQLAEDIKWLIKPGNDFSAIADAISNESGIRGKILEYLLKITTEALDPQLEIRPLVTSNQEMTERKPDTNGLTPEVMKTLSEVYYKEQQAPAKTVREPKAEMQQPQEKTTKNISGAQRKSPGLSWLTSTEVDPEKEQLIKELQEMRPPSEAPTRPSATTSPTKVKLNAF